MLQKSKSKKSNQLKLTIVLPFLALFLMSFNVEEVYVAKAEITEDGTKTETFTITSKSSDKEIEFIKNKLETQADGLKIKFSNLKRNSKGEIINLSIETKLKGKNRFNHSTTYQTKSNNPIENIALKIENNQLVFGDKKQDMVMRVTERGVIADKLTTKKETTSTGTIHTQNTGDVIKMEIDSEDKKGSNFIYNIQTEDTGGKKSKLIINEKGKKPLYVVDGKITTDNIMDFDAENIASVNVLKGKMAKEKYGSKGVDGVVEIRTKPKTTFVLANKGELITQDNNGNFMKNGITYSSSDSLYPFLKEKDNKAFTMVMTKTSKDGKLINENIDIISDNKLNDTLHLKVKHFSLKNNDKPLIYIDEKKSNKQQLSKLKPDNIKSMNVLKGDAAIKTYGKEARNGAIQITTKNQNYTNTNLNKDSIKTDNPWKIHVSNVSYFDVENPSKNGSSYYINKSTPESVLNMHKTELEKIGVNVKYSKIKRNSKDEITSIKISLSDEKGQKSSATYKSNKGISDIMIGLKEGNLILTSSDL